MRGLFVDVTCVFSFLFVLNLSFCMLGLLVCVLLRSIVVLFCWLVLYVGPFIYYLLCAALFYLCCCSCVAVMLCALVLSLMSFCVLMCFVNVAFFVCCCLSFCYGCVLCLFDGFVCRARSCVVCCLFEVLFKVFLSVVCDVVIPCTCCVFVLFIVCCVASSCLFVQVWLVISVCWSWVHLFCVLRCVMCCCCRFVCLVVFCCVILLLFVVFV